MCELICTRVICNITTYGHGQFPRLCTQAVCVALKRLMLIIKAAFYWGICLSCLLAGWHTGLQLLWDLDHMFGQDEVALTLVLRILYV